MAPKTRSKEPLTLTSFRQMQALAHPLRWRAFECLIEVPRTGKQLATLLGKKSTHLYHHLAVLERAGLVRRVATRKNRGTTEKYFQAVSDRVAIDERLFRDKVAVKHALIGQVFRVTFEEFIEAETLTKDKSSKRPRMIKRLRIRAHEKQIADLERRLEGWLDRFERTSDPRAENEYAVTVALYPVASIDSR